MHVCAIKFELFEHRLPTLTCGAGWEPLQVVDSEGSCALVSWGGLPGSHGQLEPLIDALALIILGASFYFR